jgi:broad specificity phosphatase PhoE
MATALPKLYVARHGDTAWTHPDQHTGRTDLPLNERGEEHARQLGEALQAVSFAHVFTSPLKRAAKTCVLAGFGDVAEINLELLEWDYGRRAEDRIVVGDAIWDNVGARRADMPSVGVLTVGYGEEELYHAGVFRVYRNFADLLQNLDELGILL